MSRGRVMWKKEKDGQIQFKLVWTIVQEQRQIMGKVINKIEVNIIIIDIIITTMGIAIKLMFAIIRTTNEFPIMQVAMMENRLV